jgi:prephenate dehydratase
VLVIFSISSCNSLRLGLLGPDGTYSSEAGVNYLKRKSIKADIYYCETISDCFNSLKNQEVDIIIVPSVNSIIGQVQETVSNLDRQRVLDCERLQINLHLAGYSLRYVHTKQEAADQCKKRVSQMNSRIIYENSTVIGAIKAKRKHRSAIVSSRAAEIYGLPILEKNIQDVKDNFTEFLVLVR